MPDIIVILTSYNNADTLDKAVQSVLMQQYADFELHIWDDGSDDQNAVVAYMDYDQLCATLPNCQRIIFTEISEKK